MSEGSDDWGEGACWPPPSRVVQPAVPHHARSLHMPACSQRPRIACIATRGCGGQWSPPGPHLAGGDRPGGLHQHVPGHAGCGGVAQRAVCAPRGGAKEGCTHGKMKCVVAPPRPCVSLLSWVRSEVDCAQSPKSVLSTEWPCRPFDLLCFDLLCFAFIAFPSETHT